MDFEPRLPLLRLTLLLLVFCFLTLMFILETKTQLEYKSITDWRLMAETVFVGLILLSFISFMLPYLLLQHRLRFTEEGIHRRTMLKPRFIPWRDVKRARMGSVAIRGGRILLLELSPEQVRWFTPPYYNDGRQRAQLFGDSSKGGAWVDRIEELMLKKDW